MVMSKEIKILLWTLTTLAIVVVAVPTLAILHQDSNRKSKQESYYKDHALLKAFHDAAINADGSIATSGPGPRRALLAYNPPGTPAEETHRRLAAEDLYCSWPPDKANRLLVCSVNASARENHFIPRWHIELNMDGDHRLTDAKIVVLK